MSQSIANLAIDITANIAGFQSDLGRVQRESQKASKQMERDFGRAGAAIGGSLVTGVTLLAAGVKSAINQIDGINDAAKRLDVSAEFLSGMGYAAKQSGADLSVFERGFTKLLRTVSEASTGEGPAADLFKSIGVEVRDANGVMREADEIFGDIADRFKEFKGGAGEVELAQRLMGKAGAQLIPLLNEGADGIKAMTDEAAQFGMVVSTESAEAAGQFNDDLDKLKAQVNGVFVSMASDLLPTLTAVSGLMVDTGGKTADAADDFSILEYGLQRVVIAGVIAKNTLEGILALMFAAGTTIKETASRIGEGVSDLASIASAGAKNGAGGALAEFFRVSADDVATAEASAAAIGVAWETGTATVKSSIKEMLDGIAAIEAPTRRAAGALKDAADAGGDAVPPLKGVGAAADATAPKLKKVVNAGDEMVATWREQNKEANAAFLLLKAQLDPLEAVRQEYEAQKEVLEQARRANVGNVEALADIDRQLQLVEAQYRDHRRAVEQQANPVQQMIEDMEFELKLMKMSNAERQEAIMLRGLEGKATAEQAARLRELIDSAELEEITREQAAEWLSIWTGAIEDFAGRMVRAFEKGGGGLEDALKESIGGALDQIIGKASRDLAEQLGRAMNGQSANVGGAAAQMGLAAAAGIGSSYVGGTSSMGQSVAGGALAGAAYGTMIMPGIGTVVGAIIGAIVGFIATQNPVLEVSSSASGIDHGKVEGRAQSAFGNIFVGKDDLTLAGNMQSQELADKIAEFDNAIASFLSGAEVQAAKDALADFDFNQRGHGIDPAKVLAARFDEVVEAISPAWKNFLHGITSLEERVQAFQGLRAMENQVEHLDQLLMSMDPDPLNAMRVAIQQMDDTVDEASAAFHAAFDARDPVAITEANAALEQAVLQRYQAEVKMVRDLQDAIEKANDSARAFGIDMAQRLVDVGANVSVAGVIGGDLGALQAAVGTGATTDASIANLDRFLGAVDQWLSAARSEVEAWASAARARVQGLLASLDAEQSGIMQAAGERAAAAQAQAQAAADAQNAANQAHIAALNEQLQIAQQWSGVLSSAQSALDAMMFGPANPGTAFLQQSLLAERIAQLRSEMASADPEDRAGMAQELIGLLNQQLGAAGELLQQPSGEYLSVFNATARELSNLRDIARTQTDRGELLQQEIASLQAQTVEAVSGVSDTLAYLSSDEMDRLDAINTERTALELEMLDIDREAALRLDEINAQARGYYEWAQTTGNELQAARHLELTTALNEITGGLDPESFIAGRLEEATSLLEEIRDAITEFLEDIATPVTPPHSPYNPGQPGNPRDPTIPPYDSEQPQIVTTIHVNVASGDPRAIADAIDARMTATLPQYASRLRQELKVA